MLESLASMRQRRGYSQQDLASLTGLSQSVISEVEAGHWQPRRSTVRLLAYALDCDPHELTRPSKPAAA